MNAAKVFELPLQQGGLLDLETASQTRKEPRSLMRIELILQYFILVADVFRL